MTAQSRNIAIIAAIVAVVAAGFGYWAYDRHKQRELHAAVTVLLKDASARMRDALGMEAAPPTVDRTRFLKSLEGHVATAERNLLRLQRLEARWGRALVSAADDYLLTTREILKRQADSHRHRLSLLESARLLREHMGADDRSSAWVKEAVSRKDRAERDYRDFRLAVNTYLKLLEQFPASQAKIKPYLEPALAIEDAAIAQARRGALDIDKQLTAEMESLRKLHPGR